MPKYFQDIPTISYEGPDSDNPFAYRWYNPQEVVLGKTMAEWLRFAVCYWHTFRGVAADPFGPGTLVRPWEDGSDSLAMALRRTDVMFEFVQKLGLEYYCFHDRDVAPEGKNVEASNKNLWKVAEKLRKLQDKTGIKLLWGTANMFSHPRFNQGASTSPNADVFAYCANSVKTAMEVTKFLDGENYVFWGGREGYMSLLNTDLGREQDHLGLFLQMAVEHAKKIGFTGQFLIEPKPCEPTKHQYDYDAATVLGFLRKYRLTKHFKLNIETNHATLAGHELQHELEVCRTNNALGSIDANRGDLMNGWDTDQFPTDVKECTLAMLSILKQGGLAPGGLNFDAKVRRDSTDVADMFHGHIGGIDVWAQALRIAAKIKEDGNLDELLTERYSTWDSGIGKKIESGKASFTTLSNYIIKKGEVDPTGSAKQELCENILNRYF